MQNTIDYSALADLVGVKIDESHDGVTSEGESYRPSSGMISARRKANAEIGKAVSDQVKISIEMKEKVAA